MWQPPLAERQIRKIVDRKSSEDDTAVPTAPDPGPSSVPTASNMPPTLSVANAPKSMDIGAEESFMKDYKPI